jgi:hypothetical protein
MALITVSKLLSQKEKMSKSAKNLRFLLAKTKKELLEIKMNYIKQKTKFRTKFRLLKTENKQMKLTLGYIDDYVVDSKTGVIDLTQTPPKPQRVSGSKNLKSKKLKF